MSIKVSLYDAPDVARNVAVDFLAREPVLNNLVLTLLAARIVAPEPGRYWVAFEHGAVAGVGLQSPVGYAINLTSMSLDAACALADAICAEGHDLPGVMGEARIAARFAGQWTEQRKAAAHPTGGQRLYEAPTLHYGPTAPGRMERAGAEDRALIYEWMTAFLTELGEPANGVADFVERRVSAGEVWVWNDTSARCMAAVTAPVAGASRVQYVYTPPQHRGRGYAETLVRTLTGELLRQGLRPMLFADLSNPTSNGIYLRIGYKAVAEFVRYRFGPPGNSQR